MSGIASDLQRNRAKTEGSHQAKFLGQDYDALRQGCLANGTLFEDPLFDAIESSLGFDTLGPGSFKIYGVEWKRPKEVTSNPQFIIEGATTTDVCQGALGDCWLLAAIASLTLNKGVLSRVVPDGQSFDEGYAGIFHFQIWQFGEWMDVVIDDRLPVRNGKLLFLHSAESSEFWSALLEKAYAKLHGCYEALAGGSSTEGFVDFTGGVAERFKLSQAPPTLFRTIQKALSRESLLGCSINTAADEAPETVTSKQLVKGHAYSVTGAEEIEHGGGHVKLIRMRNPWGEIEWKGAWSDSSGEWQDVSEVDRKRLQHRAEDGEFWMAYSDFLEQFSVLEVCNLTPDRLANDQRSSWRLSTFEGRWRKGSTAGGCRNFPKTFWMNPQFVICLEKDEDGEEEGCSFLVGLLQKNRKNRRIGQDMHTIGFAIYEVPEEHVGKRNVHLDRKFFQRYKQKARSHTYVNLREVVTRFCLPPGEYIVVPSTYQPDLDGDFFIRVFSETQAQTHELDDPVEYKEEEEEAISEHEVDGKFKTHFGQLAGEDNEISAFELRKILNKVVTKRQDIKTNGFGLDTCHQMINLLDCNGNGKLGLVEFKALWNRIDKYLKIYRHHDEDKSGTISSIEMRPALEEAGFFVNNSLHQNLVSRYSDANLTVDFDDFVSCLVRLETMFKLFKALDTDGTGNVKFQLSQWLYVTLL